MEFEALDGQGGPLGQGGLEAVGREGNLKATQDAG